jgi:hypothetical protein
VLFVFPSDIAEANDKLGVIHAAGRVLISLEFQKIGRIQAECGLRILGNVGALIDKRLHFDLG